MNMMFEYIKYIDDSDKRLALCELISSVREYNECLEILNEDRQEYRVTRHWDAGEICGSFIDKRMCKEYILKELAQISENLINNYGIELNQIDSVRHNHRRETHIDGQISIEEYLKRKAFIDRIENFGIPYTLHNIVGRKSS